MTGQGKQYPSKQSASSFMLVLRRFADILAPALVTNETCGSIYSIARKRAYTGKPDF